MAVPSTFERADDPRIAFHAGFITHYSLFITQIFMTRFFTLLGLAFCWLPLQAQRLSPAQPQAAPYVLRPTPTPVKTLGLEDFFPQLRQSRSQVSANPALRLGGKGHPASLSSVALPVQAGQLVEAQLWAYAQKPAPWLPKRLPLAIGAAALGSQLSLPGRGEGGSAQAQSLTLPLLTAGAVLAPPLVKALTGGKKAYARLRFYDQEGRLVQESTQSVSKQARKSGELLSLRLTVPQKGFVQMQVVNKSKQEVYFEEGQMASLPLSSPARLDFSRPDTLSENPQPDSDSAQSLSVRKPLPIGNDGDGGGNNGGGGSPFNTGRGTQSDPYVLPTLTVRASVPTNRYQELANGLFYVQPGNYGNFHFPSGFYRQASGGGNSGGGGGGGTSSGDNAPPPLPNKLDNVTFPVSPKNGQVLTYLDSQGNRVTLVYNKALNSWVLPAVTAKGTPPANSTVKTYYYYQDPSTQRIEVYVWTGTQWVIPMVRATHLDNEKEVEVVDDPCAGYKRMLELQKAKGKEAAAFVTKDGKVFILPMEKNIYLKSETRNQYVDSQNRVIMTVYQAQASDAPDLSPGRWYLTTAVRDAQGRPTYTTYPLASHVHTHPINGRENVVSPDDKNFDKTGSYP